MRSLIPGLVAAMALVAPASAGWAQSRAAPPATGDNVTVVGKRQLKACGDRDSGCIMAVAKQLWQDYPRQIELYCNRQTIVKMREQQDYEEFLGNSLDLPIDDALPPALQTVCNAKPKDSDKNLGVALAWAPWREVPNAADLAAAYPRGAPSSGGEGRINCAFTISGRLSDCVIAEETPDKAGFGVAALKLSGRFKAKVEAARDHSYLKVVRINVAVHFPPQGGASDHRLVIPDWTRTPDLEQTASLYPAEATKAGVATGVGRVTCRVDDTGALAGCSVVGEEPAGLGFGAAALAAAASLHANLWTRDGDRAAGGYVTIPLRFNAPTTAAAEPAKTPAAP